MPAPRAAAAAAGTPHFWMFGLWAACKGSTGYGSVCEDHLLKVHPQMAALDAEHAPRVHCESQSMQPYGVCTVYADWAGCLYLRCPAEASAEGSPGR